MYHTRHKETHYEAGYKWGNLLFHNGNIIANQPTFSIAKERMNIPKWRSHLIRQNRATYSNLENHLIQITEPGNPI